ncbi:MAG: histidine kinase dimerization/phosphoacceptor domain -containing protein [Candidatus Pacebacteria bacterium]|nr:histidine kinase dimerization/phosphoacceptor domain -containing protein [Candidatus Paceibacterota bacterium]
MDKREGVRDPLGDPKDGHILTRAIIDTIREPLIVLDEELRIIAASRSFYKKFGVSHEATYDKMFYELGNGEWNVPALRKLLEQVIPEHTIVEDYEVVHDFVTLGKRTMLVNACEIRYENGRKKMLLSIDDITDQRNIEKELEKLIEQKNLLLQEMRHRIANSLQLIASILLLKADSVGSEEARLHLTDAHERILSIATVQRHLDPVGLLADKVEVGPYLTGLCESLAKSMIGGRKPIVLEVAAQAGRVSSEQAISFGLATTELVINALKYAFPRGEGKILVSFQTKGAGWKLTIEDNGVGYIKNPDNQGLGTSIVASLAKQLSAELVVISNSSGTNVSLSYPNTKLF